MPDKLTPQQKWLNLLEAIANSLLEMSEEELIALYNGTVHEQCNKIREIIQKNLEKEETK